MKSVISSILIFCISLLSPISIMAQTIQSARNTASQTRQVTDQSRQRYNPNIQVDNSGGAFQGLRFQGVSASILNCTNVTQSAAVYIGEFAENKKNKLEKERFKKMNSYCGKQDTNNKVCQNWYSGIIEKNKLKNNPNSLGTEAVDVKEANVQKGVDKVAKETEKINKTNLCLNGIAYTVAKQALQQVTLKTLNWVNNGGMYGLPLYVNNPDAYNRNIVDEEITKYLRYENDHPIFGASIRSIIALGQTGVNDGRLNSIGNSRQAISYGNFQNDFTYGGWNSFLNMSYNPVGALFNAGDQIGRSISSRQEELTTQRLAGNGFLDMQNCKRWDNGRNIYTLASLRQEEPICLEWEAVTPGSIVAGQVSAVTQSSIRQLEIADSFNEVLGSFFDSLLNNLFYKGIRGITDNGFGINTGGSFYINNYTQEDNPEDVLGYTSAGYNGLSGEFDISKPQHVRAVLQTQENFLSASADSYTAMSTIVPTLGALDYCIPGPNNTWPDFLNDNYLTFINAITDTQKLGGIGIDVPPIVTQGLIAGAVAAGAIAGSFIPIPGIGTAIGAVGGAITGLTIYLIRKNKVTTDFYSEPSLYDKTIDSYLDVEQFYFSQTTKKKKAPTIRGLQESLDKNYPGLISTYQAVYNPNYIIDAFLSAKNKIDNYTSPSTIEEVLPLYEYEEYDPVEPELTIDTDGDGIADASYTTEEYVRPEIPEQEDVIYTPTNPIIPSYDRGQLEDIFDETSNLVRYNNLISDLVIEYQESSINSSVAVTELQEINKEVQQIVRVAKARYIEEQRLKGTPVKMSCIDDAYQIDQSPVVGRERLEANEEDPFVKQSRESSNYFYTKVLGIESPSN